MNGFDIPPMPVLTRGNRMTQVQNYIRDTNTNDINIIEILRLSGAFQTVQPFSEIAFRNRTFQECYPTEESFIAWVRYDGITNDKINTLGQKYQEFINQNQNNQNQNNQQGGKRKRNKRSVKRSVKRRNKTRRR